MSDPITHVTSEQFFLCRLESAFWRCSQRPLALAVHVYCSSKSWQLPLLATSSCQSALHARRPAAIGCIMEYKIPNTSTCLNSASVSYTYAQYHKACDFGCATNAHTSTETAWQQLACYMQSMLLIHSTYCTRSAIGFLFMALIAFLAAMRVLLSSPSQKCACRSTSTVLDNSLAMSPSSRDESFMISVQLLPAAHASIIPA